MRRLLIVGVVLASVLGLIAISAAVYGTWTVRRSFPAYEGELAVAGLDGNVTVHRDAYGIPQIYADSAEDLLTAQGYVHAQDRFWEMDFRRHVTSGRLAELFGEDQVERDTFLRTLGWRRVAEQELAILSPDTRRWLQAYADGVNAYLEQRDGAELSLEYAVLGLTGISATPEPWTPADSVAWLKAMAWDLRGNMQTEIARAHMAATLPVERIEELYPPYPVRPAPADPARLPRDVSTGRGSQRHGVRTGTDRNPRWCAAGVRCCCRIRRSDAHAAWFR